MIKNILKNRDSNDLYFLPLGGSGEIGMNFNMYGFKDNWLIIDCGVSFKDSKVIGADVFMTNIDVIKDYNLKDNSQFVGYTGDDENISSLLLKNNNLHTDIIINPNSIIGKKDKAGSTDLIVESAISTIVDNEDSVAAVDAKDKVRCYRNWLGLMKGDLETEVKKGQKKFIRKLNPDRIYKSPNGSKIVLHGRALLLNRNVGHLMTNP